MKKTWIIWCVLAGLLVFAGCPGKPAAGETAGVTVRLLTDASGIDDKSFNAAAWRGLLQYYGDTTENSTQRGSLYDVVTANTQDMYIPNIQQATDEGYDLIITTGFTFADALAEVAEKNPDQKYMIVDVDWVGLPNVLQATFAEHEGSYLVGVAAALKALEDGIDNPRFGFIGGILSPTITKFEVGFYQGVLSIIPGARIDDYYVGSWDDPGSAKSQAKNWYDSGVYAIYSAAGASGNGTIAQAKEYRTQGINVWAIGVDSDQHDEGLYNDTDSAVLTSMLKRVESATLYALKAIETGSFKGETITFDLKADGVGYAVTNPALPESIKARLEEVKAQIVSGQITVAATYAAARQIPGFPQNLKAQD
ncbi:MAG: BMP family ABC transporter substrate-binding protein [Spirochaetaceae bacterium]|jgi:basic membrane protein A|nr:BMP family ABC transporter substrate-binding protein [Spirochaetaceae bacterium]